MAKVSQHPLYALWCAIKQRCYNPKYRKFAYYGGRGIALHEEWRCDFKKFATDLLAEIGPKPTPKHSLDRYPDNNGNYAPGNLRWATHSEQVRNSSRWNGGRWRLYDKERRARLIAAGRCGTCSKHGLATKTLCADCRSRILACAIRQRQRLKASATCLFCGTARADHGVLCQGCVDQRKAKRMAAEVAQ